MRMAARGNPWEMEDHERAPDQELVDDQELVEAEEQAAAAEAASIGGAGGAEEVEDEAERPLAEAGEGEAEGFELAEHDLIENAGDMGAPDPMDQAGEPEAQRSDAEYGEPDEVESTERESDSAGPER
jgi:hypothetical protein